MSSLLAYFDPGSGSLLLQTIIGGSAGLFVFAKYLWEAAPAILRSRKPSDASKNVTQRIGCQLP